MEKEDVFHIVDAVYRVHDDLFHLEDRLNRFGSASLSAAKLRTNTTMGALVAGFLAIVPILVTVSGIDWQSAPALILYLISAGLIALWIVQAISAHRTEEKLGLIARRIYGLPLESRHDYILEVIASWGIRRRLVEEVIQELRTRAGGEQDVASKAALNKHAERYEEIKAQCNKWIQWAVKTSEQMLAKGMKSQQEHEEVLDWAKPFLPS